MKLTHLLTASALVAAMSSPVAMAAESTMTPVQTKEIQKIIHEYLLSNPEVLVEVSQALQQKQQETMQQQAQGAIVENVVALLNDKMATVGNPKGNVTVVEFFDYQCIHCKKMAPVLSKLLKEDSNLRIVYKEFPIFGKKSEMASRAALSASMQGKYSAMHDALLAEEKHLNEDLINKAAKSIGLDMTKFKADMQSQAVTDALASNRQLAEKLHLMGTPAFIVASTPEGQFKSGSQPAFIPGAASGDALRDLIKKAGSN